MPQDNHSTRPITQQGLAALKARYDDLLDSDRPQYIDVVSWAAGNGERSENGAYTYARKRRRDTDRDPSQLAKAMKQARVVDPAEPRHRSRVWFAATGTLADEADEHRTLTIVGD